MKLLLFTDVHSNKKHLESVKKKSLHADVLLCLGDLTMFQAYMKSFLRELNSTGKPVLMLPGNHESEEGLKNACKDLKNLIYIHKGYYEKDGILFLGYGSGGFSQRDLGFEETSRQWKKLIKEDSKIVLLTHGPPYNTPIDIVGKFHVGNKSYREFIEKTKPVLAASGHLHENFYKIGKIGKTTILNPGPEGRLFVV